MPRIISAKRAASERRAWLNTIVLCLVVVPPALITETFATAGIWGGIFSFHKFQHTTTGMVLFVASLIGLLFHIFHIQLISGWFKRKPGDPGRGGIAIISAYAAVWIAGGILVWLRAL